MEDYKTFYPCCIFCCSESDPLHLKATIPVRGYSPGQTINMAVSADNKSNQDVSVFTVQLLNFEGNFDIWGILNRLELAWQCTTQYDDNPKLPLANQYTAYTV